MRGKDRYSTRTPVAVAAASLALVAAAAVLWVVTPGRRDVPLPPVELGPVLSVVGCLVLLRSPGQRVAAVMAATGLAFSVVALAAATLDHAASAGVPAPVQQAALAVAWLSAALVIPWMLVVLWFPDGRFTSSRWRVMAWMASAVAIAIAVIAYLFGPPETLPGVLGGTVVPDGLGGPFADPDRGYLDTAAELCVLLPLFATVSLVGRYRRGNSVVRQQIRWVLTAVVVTVVATVVVSAVGPLQPTWHSGAGHMAGTAVVLLTQPLSALAIAVAVLRYRLWDIDLLVSATVVYAVVWAVLSGLLLAAAAASGYLVGGRPALAAVVVALVVTVAFQPLRRRLQGVVESWLFGERRRGLRRLARFGESLRAATDVTDLGAELAQTLRIGLGVPWAAVWLLVRTDEGDALVSVGSAGAPPPPPMLTVGPSMQDLSRLAGGPVIGSDIPGDIREGLPKATGAVATLVGRSELIGLIACGDRHDPPLGEADREPLERFAHECALGLRNLRLESELRSRIREVEAHAVALRASRERLVRVQDEERRRIERDLHDGVQQQLVALAARLRSSARDGLTGDGCEALADAAEDTVFAMQDLARGIYPAVLTDQGLLPALRAEAGRSPLPVHLVAGPGVAGRRFAKPVETALYFVALEALANAAKHAPDAGVDLTLELEADAVALRVRDDGPGLCIDGRTAGTGLVNMRDRVAAVGGTFRVDGRLREGTTVAAVVPLPTAEETSPGPANGSSRTRGDRSVPPRPVG